MDTIPIQHAKLLIVAQQANIDLLQRMLGHAGYINVASTTDPQQAGALFAAFEPDLVLIDLMLPLGNGFAVLEQLKQHIGAGTYLPLVVLADDMTPQAKQRALALGAKDVLRKPFDAADVLLRIGNLLETRMLHQQVQQHAHASQVRVPTHELEDALSRVAQAIEGNHNDNPHPQRVGRWAARVALHLGWTNEQAERLRQAALLHDIGKLRVPSQLWNSPDRLSPGDAALVQRHTTLGSALLAGGRSPLLRMAEEIARTHHERWDGAGYPARLRGDAIPLSGRIVAIADAFDAMTHARPHQPARPFAAAVIELRRERGRQFDPAVVDAVLAVLERDGLLG